MEASPEELARRQEIRRFLTARRAAISPASAGLPGGPRRRTPGLRREEVASLAGVGVTWYTWFEQGRNVRMSASALNRIARALRLSASDESYLFCLARSPRAVASSKQDSSGEVLQHAVDGFTAGPAIASDALWNVTAYNHLANEVFAIDAMNGPFARNHLWRLFMDPARRSRYAEYELMAELAAGALRVVHAQRLDDPYLNSLIADLVQGSAEFNLYWNRQVTTLIETIQVAMLLPHHGPVRFSSVRLRPANVDGWLTLLPPADPQTARVMRKLSQRTRNARQRRGGDKRRISAR